MRIPVLLCCVLLLAASAGCDRSTTQPLRISGDTLVAVESIEVDGAPQAARCRSTFGAYVDKEGSSARITSGYVSYQYQDGTEIARLQWNDQDIEQAWPQNTITAEKPQASSRIGISVSLPFQPLTGQAVFNYLLDDESEPRTAEPFTFQCR